MAGGATGWDRADDGTHIAVRIAGHDLDGVREWVGGEAAAAFL